MEQIILFTFLSLFPFGQVIKVWGIQPIDAVAAAGAIYFLFGRKKKEKKNLPEVKFLSSFLLVALFSWILSLNTFGLTESLRGLMFFARLAAYFGFFYFAFGIKDKKNFRIFLLWESVIIAVFGWIQFFFFPSMRPFTVYGWDDHFMRLTGTFLDPGFSGILLVLGLTLGISEYLKSEKRNSKIIIMNLFLLLSLAFTYSRASYMSLLIVFAFFFKTNPKKILILLASFLIFVAFLPRSGGESVNLARTYSVSSRLVNYLETIEVFKQSPLFGIGYNNLCAARNTYLGFEPESSHSCSGSDSSILFVLASTGIAGLIVFIYLLLGIWNSGDMVVKASLASLLIHSVFVNSLFYPWVMGWTAILWASSFVIKKN